jgi:hypothetical protein
MTYSSAVTTVVVVGAAGTLLLVLLAYAVRAVDRLSAATAGRLR